MANSNLEEGAQDPRSERNSTENLPGASEWREGPYPYYVATMFMFAYMFNYLDRNVLIILTEPIKQDLGLRDWQIGMLTGPAFAFFYAILGLPIARLADRSHRVNILSIAMVVWSGMTILCGRAADFAQLALARVGVGAGEAGGSPPAASVIADYFPVERRSTALAIFNMGVPLGMFLGLVMGGWVSQHYGWRTAFLVAGAPGILLALLIKLTVREPKRTVTKATAERGSIVRALKSLWANQLYRGSILAIMVGNVAINVVVVWSPANMIRSFGVDVQTAGLIMGTLAGAGGIAGSLLGGALTDRLFRRDSRWLFWVPALAFAVLFPVVLAGNLSRDLVSYVVLLAAAYTLLSAINAPIWALSQATVPADLRATAAALMLFLLSVVGAGLGPLIAGGLSDLLEPTFGDHRLRVVISLLAVTAWPAAYLYVRTAKSVSTAPPLE